MVKKQHHKNGAQDKVYMMETNKDTRNDTCQKNKN